VDAVTPDTLHLIASLVRHGRGIATSIEKWIRTQEPAPAMREGLQLVAVARGVLTSLEGQIAQFHCTVTETDDETRAEVAQPTRPEASRLRSPSTLTAVK
jgi:hypothetical protein